MTDFGAPPGEGGEESLRVCQVDGERPHSSISVGNWKIVMFNFGKVIDFNWAHGFI
jgi:hypothetical protein